MTVLLERPGMLLLQLRPRHVLRYGTRDAIMQKPASFDPIRTKASWPWNVPHYRFARTLPPQATQALVVACLTTSAADLRQLRAC